jgi:hypothetical protein
MYIGCTKKLLDYAGIKPAKSPTEMDPLFMWTANLVTINRRKTLIAVNNATKSRFVLFGLTIKHLPKLPELMEQGIRTLLESESIRPDVIEQYLADCGGGLIFTPTASRSAIAFCNQACEQARDFSEIFEPGDLFQAKYLPWLNEEFILADSAYCYDTLTSALKKRYGSPVHAVRAMELEVTMQLFSPCKRTLIVPAHINFFQLHKILQGAFDWKCCCTHQFILSRNEAGIPAVILQPKYLADPNWRIPDYGMEWRESTAVTISEVFEKQSTVEYEYDFEENWLHTVEFKRFIEDYPSPFPYCTYAEGDAPVEGCGGAEGFLEVQTILANPNHYEYNWTKNWMEEAWWHPLDIRQINRNIRACHRRCIPHRFW